MLTTRQSSGTPAGTSDGRDLWRDWADPPEVWKAQLVVTWEAGGFKHGFFHSKLRQCMNFKRITVPFPQIFREVTLWFMLKVSSHPVPSQVRALLPAERPWIGVSAQDGAPDATTSGPGASGRLKIDYSWLVVWHMTFMFPYIGNVIIPTDELIFFRGVETTNHYMGVSENGGIFSIT